jgi:cytochrome c556
VLAAGAAPGDSPSATARRQAGMKTIAEQMKILGAMTRIGGTYDDFFAQSAFAIMQDAALQAQSGFLENRPSAEPTRAKAAIWAAGSDFQARMTRFLADIDTAVQAAPTDKADFIPLFAAVSENCKSCHEHYRAPKN